jgi:DNA-binding MarR family transcriptional regulator
MARSTTKRLSATQLAPVVRDVITRFNRRLRQARPVGELTITQLSALTSLELAGALTPRELADAERVQPPTMTKIVAKLEERGLIQRTPHPTDGRQVILAASETGRAVVAEHRRARDAWLAQRLATLTAEERETLCRASEILSRLGRA